VTCQPSGGCRCNTVDANAGGSQAPVAEWADRRSECRKIPGVQAASDAGFVVEAQCG